MVQVAIVGCGRIGQKRARALAGASLATCVDIVRSRAEAAAAHADSVHISTDLDSVLKNDNVDLVIVATPNNSLVEIATAAINAGKHVLIEKPGARHSEELEDLTELGRKSNVRIRIGFNHRYHPAFRKARHIVDSGNLGPLMFVRARYGHGGRIGYNREWRNQPKLSGGGELIDQGVHLIDLARWFLGDFTEIDGHADTFYWDMAVDDNAFLLMKTQEKKVAFLHVSCTEWKNTFSFELYGQNGKLQVDGLGGSYGVERLSWYRMLPEMGPPETTIWEYPMADDSWQFEMSEFLEDIRLNRVPEPGLAEAIKTLKVVENIYRDSIYDYRTQPSPD
jgi:predicted dehydrogenase